MPDKLTDLEIKKALECCISGDCDNCPYDEQTACNEYMKQDALDLINRLQAEIERLKDYNQNLLSANTALSNEILEAKAEAYKEFAERLRKEAFTVDYCGSFFEVVDIDDFENLLKELGGENNA